MNSIWFDIFTQAHIYPTMTSRVCDTRYRYSYFIVAHHVYLTVWLWMSFGCSLCGHTAQLLRSSSSHHYFNTFICSSDQEWHIIAYTKELEIYSINRWHNGTTREAKQYEKKKTKSLLFSSIFCSIVLLKWNNCISSLQFSRMCNLLTLKLV